MAKKILLILFYISIISNIGHAAEKGLSTLLSDRILADNEAGYVYASGNVFIERDDTNIWADSVFYDKKLNTVYAFGKVTFYRGMLGYGEYLKYNLDTKDGYIGKGEIHFFSPDKTKQKFLWGRDITICDKENFFIEEGGISSCEGEKKPWHLEGKDIKIELGEYLTTKHARLYAGGLPVLYSPYFVAPIKKDRQSGFLIPAFGFSGKDGFILNLPYYLVMDDSNDATFTLKLKTQNSVGIDNQFRYMLSKKEDGELNLALMNNYDKDVNSYYTRWRHSRVADYNLKIDMGHLNRSDYFKEYEVLSDIRTMPYLRSAGFLEYEGKREMYGANIFYSQNTGLDANSYQKFYLKKDGFLKPAGQRLYYNYNASLTSFADRNNSFNERAVFEPFIFYGLDKYKYGLYADGRARVNYYTQGQNDAGAVDKEQAVLKAGAFTDKTYLVNDKYKVVNTFKAEALLSETFNKEEKTPVLDKWDNFDASKKLTYSYEEKWYRHKDGKDIFYLSLSQDYLFSNRSQASPFSDVFFSLRYYLDYMSLDASGRYDHDKGNLRTLSITDSVNTPATKMSLTYLYSRDGDSFLNLDVNRKIGNEWAFIIGLRYDIKESVTKEISGGLEYTKSCYSIKTTVTRREVPKEQLILFSVNLFGLGEIRQGF